MGGGEGGLYVSQHTVRLTSSVIGVYSAKIRGAGRQNKDFFRNSRQDKEFLGKIALFG